MGIFTGLFSKKIIIGIHGLANKPSEKLLKKWWEISIREGFRTIGRRCTPFTFELVYWADLLHELPQDPKVTDKKSDAFMKVPYVPGRPGSYDKFTPSRIKQKMLDKLEHKMDKVFFEESSFSNFDRFANLLIRGLFKDLDFYYHRECVVPKFCGQNAREAIRQRLAGVLRKYRGREILLIAHSMGTIISYDVLTRSTPDVNIHSLITIGSPLALPVIMKQIYQEQGMDYKTAKQAATPENILHEWLNFSDLDDPVAINYDLADDFRKNSRGIAPRDTIVFNNYEFEGDRDAHNLYGYLRAPQVAQAVYEFCMPGGPGFFGTLRARIGKIFGM